MDTAAGAIIEVLFLGDVIGSPGRKVIAEYLGSLKKKPDLVIANVENAAHGFGISESILIELESAGVEIFTGGNHTFDRKEIFEFIDRYPNLLRPANYPAGTPGVGWCITDVDGVHVGVINLIGRAFMAPLESPFTVADKLIEEMSHQARVIIVDIHAEATAEKNAVGVYLDGRVTAVIGSHTHVQTADERLLPGGTAFITDAGPCGPADGVIGMDKQGVLKRFIQQLPVKFEPAAGPAMLHGVQLLIDKTTGAARKISRVQYRERANA
jgi:2',3'-cyclic-nucleotide 2'-phosphodiesterase